MFCNVGSVLKTSNRFTCGTWMIMTFVFSYLKKKKKKKSHHFQRHLKMADKEITIVTKNDTVSTNPLSAVFSKFSEGFNNLPLPFKFPLAKKEAAKVETERKATVRGGEVTEVKKTTTVTFPDARSKTTAPPLKLESEDADRQTNPLVLWQVYAVGGFFVLKWAWGRWNERRERKKPSNEDPPSSSPTVDEDN